MNGDKANKEKKDGDEWIIWQMIFVEKYRLDGCDEWRIIIYQDFQTDKIPRQMIAHLRVGFRQRNISIDSLDAYHGGETLALVSSWNIHGGNIEPSFISL